MSVGRIPPQLGKAVVTSTINWRQMVIERWGEDWAKRDIVYEFSNGEKKQSTDMTNNGIYNGGAR